MASNGVKSVEIILTELLTQLSVPFSKIEHHTVAGQDVYSIRTEGDARTLIGMHGDTLYAIDLLVKKIYENQLTESVAIEGEARSAERAPMLLIDVNDYRVRQLKELEAKALIMAERARSFQYDVELTPMSAYERLIIHTTLQGAPNVRTESQGEGRSRRVVIKYSA